MAVSAQPARRDDSVPVWDRWVRISHWSLAACFLLAYFVLEDGDPPHEIAGYVALALIALRLVWGVVGSEHARFTDFVPRPRALLAYIGDVLHRRERRYIGHNPAGAVMVLALLGTISICGISGWLLTTDAFWGSQAMEQLHELSANFAILLVVLHVCGVIYESWHQRENLVKAMFTGRKRQ